jgi:hypothetical protein
MRREFEIRTPVNHTRVSEPAERFPLVELTVRGWEVMSQKYLSLMNCTTTANKNLQDI